MIVVGARGGCRKGLLCDFCDSLPAGESFSDAENDPETDAVSGLARKGWVCGAFRFGKRTGFRVEIR